MEADLAYFQNALLEAQRELEEKRNEIEALQRQRSDADQRVAGK
jgi:cell division protein FtsL